MIHKKKLTLSALFLVVVLGLGGCGGDTPSLSIKGYTTSPARQIQSFDLNRVLDGDLRPTTTGCDGINSLCCTSGTGCNPSLFNVKVYKAWISPNTDCSSGVVVQDNDASASYQDFVTNPVIIQGTPAAGTYKCLVLKMSDNMQFKINDTTVTTIGGDCGSNTTTYTFDVYRAGETDWRNYETDTLITGTGTKDAPGDDTVYVFASTVPGDVTNASNNQKITLTNAITITAGATTSGGFVTDFNDKVNDDNGAVASGHCWMGAGSLTYVNL